MFTVFINENRAKVQITRMLVQLVEVDHLRRDFGGDFDGDFSEDCSGEMIKFSPGRNNTNVGSIAEAFDHQKRRDFGDDPSGDFGGDFSSDFNGDFSGDLNKYIIILYFKCIK